LWHSAGNAEIEARKSAMKPASCAGIEGSRFRFTNVQSTRNAPLTHTNTHRKWPAASDVRTSVSEWSVFITTAPRQDCTLQETTDSVVQCGWEPVIFAEPDSTVVDGIRTIHNPTRLGVWHNWLQACRWAIEQNPEYILSVQDDARFHPDCKLLIEQLEWPKDAGYVSLYTPSHYQLFSDRRTQRKRGFYRIYSNSMWGAVALVFRPEMLKKIIEHPIATEWVGVRCQDISAWPELKKKRIANPWMIQNSDTAIGQIVTRGLKQRQYYFSPSPVEHISKYSAIGHGTNRGKRNCRISADHSEPLIPQVYKLKKQKKPNGPA
jgi:hypothetical protein